MPAAALDRDRLAKILSMLASPHPGEALAAARAALSLINAAELTWDEILESGAIDRQYDALLTKVLSVEAMNNTLLTENNALKRKIGQITGHRRNDNDARALFLIAAWVWTMVLSLVFFLLVKFVSYYYG